MDVRFFKGQALGNDYFVIDAAELPVPLTPERAVLLCDRHRGAGSDGVLLADLTVDPVHLRIVNPDGTDAEKSGNGLRIFGAWMYGRGLARLNEWFKVRLARDVVSMRVEEELEAGAVLIRAASSSSSAAVRAAGSCCSWPSGAGERRACVPRAGHHARDSRLVGTEPAHPDGD